jgi:hypothetical protein
MTIFGLVKENKQRQKQIPPLRYGMTNKRADNPGLAFRSPGCAYPHLPIMDNGAAVPRGHDHGAREKTIREEAPAG